jgi:hypothetical protein
MTSSIDRTKITIVKFTDGSETRLFLHRGWGPVAQLQRKTGKAADTVTHAIATNGGRGDIHSITASFRFDFNKLVKV